MKNIFKIMGFIKADEMDISIQLKAIKIAWGYTVIFLVIWSIYDFYNTKNIGVPFILMVSQNIILLAVQLLYKNKMCENTEENDEE